MILLYLVLVWLIGIGLVRFLLPGSYRSAPHNTLVLSLGAGIGIGIASCLYFVTLAAAGPKLAALASVLGAVLIAALVLGGLAKPRGSTLEWASGPAPSWTLIALFLVAVAIAVILFTTHSASKPSGEWDAWSIWNLRARFLFRAGEFWKNAFSSQMAWSHPDYPLLVPGVIAMCWTLARAETTLAPMAVAFLFTFATAGVLISSIGVLRGKAQALVAGALLLGTVEFVEIGAMQYADVPLSFYILATLALLCLQDRFPDNLRFTFLAGLTAGLAAWTKNEGLLFVLAVVVARAVAIFRFGNRPMLLKHLGVLAGGLILPLAVVAFFKLRFAPPNDLTAKKPGEIIAHLTDFGRWITVIEGFVKAALTLGSFLIPIVLVLGLYWYLVRFHVEERDRLPLATVAVALGLMLLGDFGVYVLLSNDVNWQVNTSIDRIFLQLWPAGLLAFFLAANAPQLVAQTKTAQKSKPARHAVKGQRRAAETR